MDLVIKRLEKGKSFPVGTVRVWGGEEHIKLPDNTWKKLARGTTVSRYFKKTPDSRTIPLNKVSPREPVTVPDKLNRAKKLMDAAGKGYGLKRSPVLVKQLSGGRYQIVDGNRTYHVLKEMGEKYIEVKVASDAEIEYEEVLHKYKGTPLWMKAPNGALTNLTERQWAQVRTQSFKDWFGDWENDPDNASKILDENGEPMVVYHGTNRPGFNEFITIRGTQRENGGRGIHFGTIEQATNVNTNGETTGIYPVYLSIQNPLRVTDAQADWNGKLAEELQKRGYIDQDRVEEFGKYQDKADTPINDRRMIRLLQSLGFDGLVYNNEAEGAGDSYVVFEPEQIKSVNNQGTFDKSSPDIRKSIFIPGERVYRLEKAAHKLHYKTEFQGLPISIENRKGSIRRWYDPFEDRHGETKFKYPYGYIRLTEGEDGDHIDVYLGPDGESQHVFIVRQNDPTTGLYDEDKVMLGFRSMDEARRAYLEHYDNPAFLGDIDYLPLIVFRKKIEDRIPGRIEKAKDYSKLVKVREYIFRKGKPVLTTLYISPEKYESTTVRLAGNKLGKSFDKKVLRGEAKQYARKYLIDKVFKNKGRNMSVVVSKNGIDKVLHHSSMIAQVQSVPAIPEMIENAKWVRSDPDRKNRSQIKSVEKYRCLLVIDDKKYLANMVFWNMTDNQIKYYDHGLTVINKI